MGGVYAGYSWGIHGIYVCIGYVSGMYRVCIGKVSKVMGRVGGGVLTTDEHGSARKNGDVINDNIDNLRPNQYSLGAKREVLSTTDEHGSARKHGDVINDNIDNLRPNQYSLVAKWGMLLTTKLVGMGAHVQHKTKKTHLKSELLFIFLANVHFLLYLCT